MPRTTGRRTADLRTAAILGGLLLVVAAGGCRRARTFPWPLEGPREALRHEAVETSNLGYDRSLSPALVRRVKVPTRANLDFAAYHANVLLADPEPEDPAALVGSGAIDPRRPFDGVVDASSVCASLARTPLTEGERARALAFSPLVDWLAKKGPGVAGGLEEVRAAIRGEAWGLGGGPHVVRLRASEAFVHHLPGGGPELWLRIEFPPWMNRAFAALPDEDGDGHPEIFARVRADLVPPGVFELVGREYAHDLLDAKAVQTWANELASLWYPTHNTDLAEPQGSWPDRTTERAAVDSLSGQSFPRPAVVLVGKPQGTPIYNVFLVDGLTTAPRAAAGGPQAEEKQDPGVSPRADELKTRIGRELAEHGGTWEKWAEALEPFHRRVKGELAARDRSLKALIGRDGFLFFRASLDQMVGGDLRAQPPGKDPFLAIVEFQRTLAARGIDFLFVPVPTKAAVFPDKLRAGEPDLAGRIVTPYERKLLLELAQAGVEVVDLLPLLLAERVAPGPHEQELYLARDTHWSNRGLRLAASAIAARVRQYPWFSELEERSVAYAVRPATFREEGDLPSRLSPSERKKLKPLELVGQQVVLPDGSLYDDDPASTVVVLGDSFTAVFQRTFCRNAGLSAHLARELRHPVDLVASYGGGPNVRAKLLRRGPDALAGKRLVIWVMAARDLFHYWEDWAPLESK